MDTLKKTSGDKATGYRFLLDNIHQNVKGDIRRLSREQHIHLLETIRVLTDFPQQESEPETATVYILESATSMEVKTQTRGKLEYFLSVDGAKRWAGEGDWSEVEGVLYRKLGDVLQTITQRPLLE